MKKSVKALSVVLSVLMIVSALPLSVFAGILTPGIPMCTEHEGGTATCQEYAICDYCEEPYGELGNHVYDNDSDPSCNVCFEVRDLLDPPIESPVIKLHVYDDVCDNECNICGEIGVAPHKVGVPATCTSKAVCELCGVEYGEFLPHNVDGNVWHSDSENHWNKCSDCDYTESEGVHFGGTATCIELAKCEICQASYGEFSDHVYDGSLDSNCNVCGFDRNNQSPVICFIHIFDDENDLLCNRCNAVREFEIDENLTFKSAALVLDSCITVKYRVEKEHLDELGYSDPFVTFMFAGKNFGIVQPSEVNEKEYVFLFRGVTPEKFMDKINATLYVKDANGEYVQSGDKEYSIATYCFSKFSNAAKDPGSVDSKLLTLLADLMNYGDKAQLYFNYCTSNLVSKKVQEKLDNKEIDIQISDYITNITEDDFVLNGIDPIVRDNEGDFKWTNIIPHLNSGIAYKIYFTATGVDLDGVTIKVKIDGYNPWTFTKEDFVKSGDGYVITFDELYASEMRLPFTVWAEEVDENGETWTISGTLTYSFETYAAWTWSKEELEKDPKLADLTRALILYGDSVKNYVY